MKSFVLYERADGRIILDEESKRPDSAKVLECVNGKDWLDAQSKLTFSDMYHNPGHGYFRR